MLFCRLARSAINGRPWTPATCLCVQDKAAWKRTSREQANLAAAKAILHGADEAQQEPGAGEPDMSSSCCPERPRFRATATLRELGVLMQQAVAEAPYLE